MSAIPLKTAYIVGYVLIIAFFGMVIFVIYRKNAKLLEYRRRKLAELYLVMQQLLKDAALSRVLVLEATNPFKEDCFSSVVYEAFDVLSTSVVNEWNEQRVDVHYRELLKHIIKHDYKILRTEMMPVSMLRTVYEAAHLKKGIVQLVKYEKPKWWQFWKKTKVIYISVTNSDDAAWEKFQQDKIRAGFSNVKKVVLELEDS